MEAEYKMDIWESRMNTIEMSALWNLLVDKLELKDSNSVKIKKARSVGSDMFKIMQMND